MRGPFHEIEKTAFLEELKEIVKENPVAVGTAGVAGGAALGLARNPGIRRAVWHHLKSLATGVEPRAAEMGGAIPKAVDAAAKETVKLLRRHGVDPSKVRIAVSGAGGTGKSTFARALEKETGLGRLHLDPYVRARDLYGSRKAYGLGSKGFEPSVIEQSHLINRVNPDKFDVVVHMSKDPKVVKKQLFSRGRGAQQADLYDDKKLRKALRASFDSMEGKAFSPAPGVEVKLKAQGGFKSEQRLADSLRRKGIDPEGMTRQQMVISEGTGKKEWLDGILPFLKPKALEAVVYPVAFGAAGVGASKALKD